MYGSGTWEGYTHKKFYLRDINPYLLFPFQLFYWQRRRSPRMNGKVWGKPRIRSVTILTAKSPKRQEDFPSPFRHTWFMKLSGSEGTYVTFVNMTSFEMMFLRFDLPSKSFTIRIMFFNKYFWEKGERVLELILHYICMSIEVINGHSDYSIPFFFLKIFWP